ncbi:MAG: hypothetical protein IKJ89_09915 [Kiritimatiellae bacterium]|nr:hypothetical protein [Kiritimatiellia bacterium]
MKRLIFDVSTLRRWRTSRHSLVRRAKNRFYRLEFSAKCAVDGYWWVDFFDKDGVQLPDVNSRLYASEDWMSYNVIVPAHPAAAFGQIAFVAKKGAFAKDVTIRRASVAAANS